MDKGGALPAPGDQSWARSRPLQPQEPPSQLMGLLPDTVNEARMTWVTVPDMPANLGKSNSRAARYTSVAYLHNGAKPTSGNTTVSGTNSQIRIFSLSFSIRRPSLAITFFFCPVLDLACKGS